MIYKKHAHNEKAANFENWVLSHHTVFERIPKFLSNFNIHKML